MGSTIKTKFGDLQVSDDIMSGAFNSIPIVDLKNINSPDISQRRDLALQLKDACIRVGFFYIKVAISQPQIDWRADVAESRNWRIVGCKDAYESTRVLQPANWWEDEVFESRLKSTHVPRL